MIFITASPCDIRHRTDQNTRKHTQTLGGNRKCEKVARELANEKNMASMNSQTVKMVKKGYMILIQDLGQQGTIFIKRRNENAKYSYTQN